MGYEKWDLKEEEKERRVEKSCVEKKRVGRRWRKKEMVGRETYRFDAWAPFTPGHLPPLGPFHRVRLPGAGCRMPDRLKPANAAQNTKRLEVKSTLDYLERWMPKKMLKSVDIWISEMKWTSRKSRRAVAGRLGKENIALSNQAEPAPSQERPNE